MPRPSRAVVPGQTLHLIQRGNNRGLSFTDDADFEYYLRVARDVSARVRCAIHAYVLMTNHAHFLLTPADADGPSRMMQGIGRRYVRYFNDRHGRTGTLWEGRFRSTLIDSERYFLACSRYIELKPVRAGMVSDAGAYRWSSFRGNARGTPDPLVNPHAVYRELGATATGRQVAYRALFSVPLDTGAIEEIRQATKTGAVLGKAHARAGFEAALQRPLSRYAHGGARRGEAFRSLEDGSADLNHHRFSTTLTP